MLFAILSMPFAVPRLVCGDPLRLSDLLQEAQSANPEILAAQADVASSLHRVPQARALEDPLVGLMQWAIPGGSFNPARADETWYIVDQNFPFPGKRSLRGEIARQEAAMKEEEAVGVERRVLAGVKRAYFDLFFAHKALEVHHEQIDLTRKLSKIAEERFSAGVAPQQDLLRAQVELAILFNTITTLEREKEVAAARLNGLINRPPDAPLGLPEPPSLPDATLTFGQMEEEILSRPEVRMQALAITREDKAVALAQRDWLPDFMLEGAYWDVHNGKNQWMLSVKINVPWLNKGKYDARIAEQRSARSKAKALYKAAVTEALTRLKEILVRLDTARRTAKLYQTTLLPLARQSLDGATIGYQAKKNDFLTLMEAEKMLRETELKAIEALVETNKAMADLEEIIGNRKSG